METTGNIFTDGLNTDTHPLTTPNNVLTDALNATLRTYNGNEMVLQNDMGNTLVLDSLTGAIMQLSEGFVPVGMKEYGGVLYIASYNPKDKRGELGSIPSPLIKYTYDPTLFTADELTLDILLTEIEKEGSEYNIPEHEDKLGGYISESYVPITDKVAKVGDLFIPVVNILLEDEGSLKRCDLKNTWGKNKPTRKHFARSGWSWIEYKDSYYPLISAKGVKGYYKFSLVSLVSGRSPIDLHIDNAKTIKLKFINGLTIEPKNQDGKSLWFFVPSDLSSDIDYEYLASNAKDCYYVYPNIPKGILAVKITAELPGDLHMGKNNDTNEESPFYFFLKDLDQY